MRTQSIIQPGTIQKQSIAIFFFSIIAVFATNTLHAQIIAREASAKNTTTIRTNPTASVVQPMVGKWNGTQTNSTGLYPQNISFELNPNGEFLMKSADGVVACKGTYTFSNNRINGSYKQNSSGETYSFTGSFDPNTQILTCTLGSGTSVTDQGKWIAIKQPAPSSRPAPAPKQGVVTNNEPANETERIISEKMKRYFPDYYLKGVKIIIYSGADSKELPSKVDIRLQRWDWDTRTYASDPWGAYLFHNDINNSNKIEYKSNTATEINLINYINPPVRPTTDFASAYFGPDKISEVGLSTIQKHSLRLSFLYISDGIFDAWKIEKVIMVLRFEDINGVPHPTLNNKEIIFMNVNQLMTWKNISFDLNTDGFLMPKN